VISIPEGCEKSFLEESIESLRKEMIRVGTKEGLSSNDTIKISQILDLYITTYQKFE
jgi:hypothetical protein